MNVWLSSYTLALGGLFLIWAAVSTYVIVTRALFDTADLSFHTARRVFDRRVARGASPAAALRGLPRRTLAGLAADASTPRAVAGAAAVRLLERRSARVIRRAGSHRSDTDKWRRVAALRILSIADAPDAIKLLTRALDDPDPDVVGGTIAILGARRDRVAAELLVDALRRDRYPRSRIAAQLDLFDDGFAELIVPLLDERDPATRQWGATLLARHAKPSIQVELAVLIGDDDPQVRAAAIKGLTSLGGALATAVAITALGDPVWYVRAHGARALGRLGRADLANEVVALLADERWWVRTAAKESLLEMGTDASPYVMAALQSEDEFMRNGAAEVLQNAGIVDKLVGELSASPSDPLAEQSLRAIFAAGGRAVAEAAVTRADPSVTRRVQTLSDELAAPAA
jgi:HEAT repeat protein